MAKNIVYELLSVSQKLSCQVLLNVGAKYNDQRA